MRLYTYFRSSAAYRVRIALNLKGLAYESIPVNLLKGEHGASAYMAVNPQGRVPSLETDGAVLIQSPAILEYLEETHPEPPLLPSDPVARARVRHAHCGIGRIYRVRARRRAWGRVVAQAPRAGSIRARGYRVRLTVGRR